MIINNCQWEKATRHRYLEAPETDIIDDMKIMLGLDRGCGAGSLRLLPRTPRAPPAGTHKRASATPIAYYLDKGATDTLELGVREAFQLWADATKFKFSYGAR